MHQTLRFWKFSPSSSQRDMEWDSPWVKALYWHIECSAMAMKYLEARPHGHTGGIDHIPGASHNEIARS